MIFWFSYCFPVGNELLVASVEKGIYKMKNSKFEKIEGWSVLENNVIHAIENTKTKRIFLLKKMGFMWKKMVFSALGKVH